MLTLNNKKKIGTDQRGFTLIEVLVSLAIFAIGIIACYAMQARSTGTAGRANSVSTSSTWSTYLQENLMARDYNDPLLENRVGNAADGMIDIDDTAAGTPDGVMHVASDGTVTALNTSTSAAPAATDLYSIYWNVADNRPLAGLKQIRITVVKNGGLNAGVLYSQDYYKLNKNF
ncbi:prepilin-type N-terminal cleavage/methylation domain-containing protein [Desulfopila sp. IMCC35006]|uniref:type IV pilus modification PilV family protein n=1 Tax=Desulfopila sp. IMCC35006 TaxID=2569542 RepID=UPI00142EFB85|nr:prepilin-type N-terminal cleavage/methylation domain-containing protein [Desulfopila sp. IMCC35006]